MAACDEHTFGQRCRALSPHRRREEVFLPEHRSRSGMEALLALETARPGRLRPVLTRQFRVQALFRLECLRYYFLRGPAYSQV